MFRKSFDGIILYQRPRRLLDRGTACEVRRFSNEILDQKPRPKFPVVVFDFNSAISHLFISLTPTTRNTSKSDGDGNEIRHDAEHPF